MRAVRVVAPFLIALVACNGGNRPAKDDPRSDSALAMKKADSVAARLHRQLEQCRVSSQNGPEMTRCLVRFDWSADSAQAAGQAYQVALDIAYRDDRVKRIRNGLTIACMPKDSIDMVVRNFIKGAGNPPDRKVMDLLMDMTAQLGQSMIELRAIQGLSPDCK